MAVVPIAIWSRCPCEWPLQASRPGNLPVASFMPLEVAAVEGLADLPGVAVAAVGGRTARQPLLEMIIFGVATATV